MPNLTLLYVTFPDPDSAQSIGNHLLKERLAACINDLPAIQSRYDWDGQLMTSTEYPALIKTHPGMIAECITRLQALHPYEIPCILELSASSTPEFEKWVYESTKTVASHDELRY